MKSRLSMFQKIFLNGFILSTLFILVLLLGNNIAFPVDPFENLLIIYIPLFTSVITFLGFLITSILSFRREKREARDAELSQKLKEVELERARLELEQLKKQVKKKK